jgi:hypothetical protein
MSTVEILTTLQNTKKYIQAHGWTQGAAQASDGKVCLVRAIGYANLKLSILSETRIYLRNFLPRNCKGDLIIWNDTKSRRKSQVIALLDKAITAAEASLAADANSPPSDYQ